jgi:3-hydroxybutyryl-CoA dehydrogenase
VDVMRHVGVVGCGLMGSGIAEVLARAELDVVVCEADATAAQAGRRRIERSLEQAVLSGKLTELARETALSCLTFTTDPIDFADRELVIEAVSESEELKREVMGTLDKVVADPHAILATNTSSIPIMKLGAATQRPEQVIGMHFFNPAPVLKLVELVPSLATSDQTTWRAEEFVATTLERTVVRVPDRAGFVVNALLIPYLLSAIRMVESGPVAADDVDRAMVKGCAHPIGPLALADLIGLDTVKAVADSLYDEFKEPLYSPPPLLSRMVSAGLLGRKAGRGFHCYAGV